MPLVWHLVLLSMGFARIEGELLSLEQSMSPELLEMGGRHEKYGHFFMGHRMIFSEFFGKNLYHVCMYIYIYIYISIYIYIYIGRWLLMARVFLMLEVGRGEKI